MALALMNEAEMMYRQFQQQERDRRELQRLRDRGDWPRGGQGQQQMSNSTGWINSLSGLAGMGASSAAAWGEIFGESPAIADTPRPVPAKPSTKMLDVIDAPEMDMDNVRVGLAVEVEDLLGYSALRKDVKAPSKLQRILAALEIEVYGDEKVAEYKQKMQAHFQGKADNADRERIQKTRGRGRMTQTVVNWRLVSLSSYKKPVPEHVLRKCVQIKKAAPEATFHVDELVEETRTLDPFMVVRLGEDTAVIEVWDEPTFEE